MRKFVGILLALMLLMSCTVTALGAGNAIGVVPDGGKVEVSATRYGDWRNYGGYWYFQFRDNGAYAYGWLKVDGVWYYFDTYDGSMYSDQWCYDNGWYYLTESGAMFSNTWQKLGGEWYYFKSSGVAATGWYQIGGEWYYFTDGGEQYFGWLQSGRNWYFLDPTNESGVMLRDTTARIDGSYYSFDYNGRLIAG